MTLREESLNYVRGTGEAARTWHVGLRYAS